MRELHVPGALRRNCAKTLERRTWLERLPATVAELADRWKLESAEPFAHEGEASWVHPVTRHDGTPAVLKIGMPHVDAEHEAAALRFWDGEPTVLVLESDDDLGAMLLERGEPGEPLSTRLEAEQDEVLARCLKSLWRPPPNGHAF